jgi:hypothetical protein
METTRRLNKTEAGYHLLQLLSAIDGKFTLEEDLVIRKYLVENYPFRVSLDSAMDHLSALPPEDYVLHFQKCMDDFYSDSTRQERIEFLDFATQLVKADNEVTMKENIFLNMLFNAWDSENEGL